MKLSDFETTKYRGLYISKEPHETYGHKYVARFQLNKKRYVRVLGYEKVDKLTDETAYHILLEYKRSLGAKPKNITKSKVATNSKNIPKLRMQ